MNERTQHASSLRGLAWMLFALAALAVVGGRVLTGIKLADDTLGLASAVSSLAFVPAGLAFSIVGLLVALRRPENPAGWFMLVIGAFWSVLTLAPRRRLATAVVLEPDLGPPPRPDGHAPAAAAPGRRPPIAALAVGLARLHARDRARGRGAPVRRIAGQRPPERGGIDRSRAAPRVHHRLGGVVVRPGTEGRCRRTPPAPVDRAGRTDVHRVLCARRGTRTPRDRAGARRRRRHRQHARGDRVLGGADRHRDRDLEVPALRHRRRDPQGVGVRLARGVLHGGVRTRRRWCGGGDGLTVDPDAVVRGRGARGDRIPTGVGSRQTVRRQGRVREAFDPVRGTGGARRAAGRDVRGR